MDNIYKNIRYLRKQKGMSQNELAELSGYTDRSSIAKIENGDVDISNSKISLFAKIFNISVRELMDIDIEEWDSDADKLLEEIYKKQSQLSPDEAELLLNYQKLNGLGKDRAREDVADLTEIPKYIADYPDTMAAHFDGEEMTDQQKAAVARLNEIVKQKS